MKPSLKLLKTLAQVNEFSFIYLALYSLLGYDVKLLSSPSDFYVSRLSMNYVDVIVYLDVINDE